MTFLTAEFCFIKSFRAFGVAFAGRELPAGRAGDTLVLSRSAAALAAHVTFLTDAAVAVIALFTCS